MRKPVNQRELDNRLRALHAARSRLMETREEVWNMAFGLGADARASLGSYVIPMLKTRIRTLDKQRKRVR